MKKLLILSLIFLVFGCKKTDNNDNSSVPDTVTDIDGNVYHTLTIGKQVWMVENLRTTRYNDGSSIPLVVLNTSWDSLGTPRYCWYGNDINNKNIYGAMYNWFAVNTGKLAPTGWHVPTDEDWQTLEDFLIANGYNYDGTTSGNKIAKAMSATTNWNSSTTSGTVGNTDYPAYRNKSGFTAFPGGYREINGEFYNMGDYGYLWSSSEFNVTTAYSKCLTSHGRELRDSPDDKRYGNSVRCIKN